jgi:hypothetical protein
MAEMSDQELLDALGVETKSEKKSARTPREERIIAGFEEIQRFVNQHGRVPEHGENKDIFERLYATRLDQIRAKEECRSIVSTMDFQGLIKAEHCINEPRPEYSSDEELLAELGIESPKENDVTFLKHVKTRAEIRSAEEIGQRTPCNDFEKFRPLFKEAQEDIKSGKRKTIAFNKDGSVGIGNFFILSGQMAYISEIGNEFIGSDGRKEYRLRVIFDNGVESNQLMRSLQKRLWEDKTSRRITDISMGPLFDDIVEDDDNQSGTIYVLRSKSDHPVVVQYNDVIHKIGVTGGDVKKRISNANLDPTYLMADVEIVATYELYNINRSKLEKLLHRFFESAKLDIEIQDRFGNPVIPREWFLVPLFVIDEVIEKVKDGTIVNFAYDASKQQIRESNK